MAMRDAAVGGGNGGNTPRPLQGGRARWAWG